MLRIDRNAKSLVSLDQKSLPNAGLREREDLQQMIRNSPDAFFAEMNESLLLVGEEIQPTDFVEDRIDLLAVDATGNSVIIELKRGANKLQLLQSLTYAAMVAKWDGHRLIEERQRLTGGSPEDVESDFENFLNEPMDNLNTGQRIILMAEGFEYEVMVAAEWLTEKYEMDIRCYRLKLSTEGENEYLSCTCIYPPPEITDHSVRRGRRSSAMPSGKWVTWQEALNAIENSAVRGFFQREWNGGRENYLRHRKLWFRIGGQRRLATHARNDRAYVWQLGRFEGDVDFWRSKLGEDIDCKSVKKDRCLRFYMRSDAHFKAFSEALTHELSHKEFTHLGTDSDADSDLDEA